VPSKLTTSLTKAIGSGDRTARNQSLAQSKRNSDDLYLEPESTTSALDKKKKRPTKEQPGSGCTDLSQKLKSSDRGLKKKNRKQEKADRKDIDKKSGKTVTVSSDHT